MKKIKLQKQSIAPDKKLILLVLALTVMGLIAVADASAPQALNQHGDKFFFFKQQITWATIGIFAFFIVSFFRFTFWEKIATPLFFFTILLLLMVLIPQLSLSALGARRWISIGSVNFQPSELVKLSLAIYLAKVAQKNKGPLSYFLPFAAVAGLIMLQPDLGTTMIVSVIGFSQIFVSSVNLIYFFGAIAVGAISTLLLILTSPYRKDRLMTFLEASSDPLGKGYHIRQVLLSLGSGGVFGVGFGASRQKYSFLPEASTDSIFAVIAEELGLVGACFIVALFVYFLLKGMAIARRAPDTFSQVLATGITAWISGQAFLNIASMVALVPLTGIPLPFFSYGGSSLVTVLIACGILLNISRYGTVEKRKT